MSVLISNKQKIDFIISNIIYMNHEEKTSIAKIVWYDADRKVILKKSPTTYIDLSLLAEKNKDILDIIYNQVRAKIDYLNSPAT